MDGQPVNPEVSEGTPAPAVAQPTVDPLEEKVNKAVQEALKRQESDLARRIQSEADKRAAPLYRRLQEAENRARLLEGTLATLPNRVGEVDPEVRTRLRAAAAEGRLGMYETERQNAFNAQREYEFKMGLHEDTRAEVARMGINPDDPRIAYNLDADTPNDYYKGVMASVARIKEEDTKKTVEELVNSAVAKARKDTGVDSHDAPGSAPGNQTFTRAQIRDRAFYKAHQAEIDKAAKEGRIKE